MPPKRGYNRRDPGAGNRPPIDPLLKLLPRAHRMLESGQHTAAARIFLDLARKTEDRGMLRIAPNLYLQAGRAQLLSGHIQEGSELLRYGLSLFQTTHRWHALDRASQQVCAELDQLGFPDLVAQIESFTRKTLPPDFESQETVSSTRNRIPVHCPTCLGVLKPGQVEISSNGKAVCPFCGYPNLLSD